MLPMILFLLSSENKNSLKKRYMEIAKFCLLKTQKSVLGSSVIHYSPQLKGTLMQI